MQALKYSIKENRDKKTDISHQWNGKEVSEKNYTCIQNVQHMIKAIFLPHRIL